MSYALISANDSYAWVKPTHPTQTTTQTLSGMLFNFFQKPATVTTINKFPIHGTLQRINHLQSWGTKWDGEDVIAVSAASVARASALIDLIYSEASSLGIDWADPNVTASPQGEVVLEWWNREKKITLYVNENHSDYVQAWGTDIDTEMTDGVLFDADVSLLFAWLEA